MSYVEVSNITKTVKDKNLLENVSFTIEKGEIISLLGSSGAGKTTLLRVLAGLESVTSGNILINGQDVTTIPAQERGVGMVFQQPLLFPQLTVGENIAFAMQASKKKTRSVKEWLEAVGLQSYETVYPNTLSGGQQQRVAFVRSLAASPSLLLLDEPFSALDPSTREDLRLWLRTFLKEQQTTAIFVTHDMEEGTIIGDKIAWVEEGQVVQVGTSEELKEKPKHEQILKSLGEGIPLPTGGFIRQKHLMWDTTPPTNTHFAGNVIRTIAKEEGIYAYIQVAELDANVLVKGIRLEEGQKGYLTFPKEAVEFLEKDDNG
ncbi:ABC transporter ATP-binding protein [Mangrovibacillus cuniculi]|uniref:Carnitine transport ATP-binding protein OpuCA n=1 Tax=Mangrovibacillus cuniculi TaxID=2593652 RepID=A0A7S8HGM8_9BACI|nr:ABC transporter ATP-binding protein [Mangrovibacillus cuniculi]QPC48169.1 ABC transporter ATP-binding protein [Mangrovibacillus cuniculi]